MQNSKLKPLRDNEWIRELVSHALALVLFVLILLNRSPNVLRPLSMNISFGFTLILPLLYITIYLLYSIKGWLGHWLAASATLSIFGLALAGIWASGHTQSTLISGLIPLYDAQSYYIDALRLLAGRSVEQFTAARPLFAGLFATLLGVTSRNLTSALMILTAMNGLATFFTAREIQATHGSAAAAFLVVFIFFYFRYRTVGTIMSEALGLPLGLLGTILFWHGISKQSSTPALYGLFITSVALNVRPGPFFLLPAILIWGSWYFRNSRSRTFFSPRFFFAGLGAIIMGFALNFLIIKLIAISASAPFSQFSFAFYGLASGGKSYVHIFEVHPELQGVLEPQRSQMIYQFAFELIRKQPTSLLKGAIHNWSIFFSNSGYGVFSYISGENDFSNMITHWGIYLLCLLGGIKALRKPDQYIGFTLAGYTGIVASVPFVPPSDAYGLRLYAAGVPILGLLPMCGLVFLLENLKFPVSNLPIERKTNPKMIVGYSAAIITILLAGPLLVRGSYPTPDSSTTTCNSDIDSIAIQYDPNNSIQKIREKDPSLDWVPVFHQGIFKRNIHSLPDSNLAELLSNSNPSTTMFTTLDYISNQAVMIIIPTSELPQPGTLIGLCGSWVADPSLQTYNLFVAESVESVNRVIR